LHHQLVHRDGYFLLSSRVGDLDFRWLFVQTIEYRLHQTEKIRDVFADFRISLDHRGQVFEMFLKIARQFVSMIRAFSAGQNRATDALRITSNCRQREMGP